MEEATMRQPLLAELDHEAAAAVPRESVEEYAPTPLQTSASEAAEPHLALHGRDEEMMRMGLWEGALVAGYLWTRGWVVLAGLPSDGVKTWNAADISDDVSRLLAYGLVLGWLVGVTHEDRAAWLFSWRRWWLWATFAGTQPVFAAIGEIPGLQVSLADIPQWGPLAWAVLPSALAAGASVAAWHVVFAWRSMGWRTYSFYVLSRWAPLLFYAGSYALFEKAARDTPGSSFHLHHLYIGWLLASWASFNSLASGALLAIGTGIFVQGVAAYDFADLFCEARCSHIGE